MYVQSRQNVREPSEHRIWRRLTAYVPTVPNTTKKGIATNPFFSSHNQFPLSLSSRKLLQNPIKAAIISMTPNRQYTTQIQTQNSQYRFGINQNPIIGYIHIKVTLTRTINKLFYILSGIQSNFLFLHFPSLLKAKI